MTKIVAAAALVAFGFVSGPAYGQIAEVILSCDQAAASPLDQNRPKGVPGVSIDRIDPKIAVPACETAATVAPRNIRIAYQLGRAYFATKAYESARMQYDRASKEGYALATNNLAIIYMEGLGVPVDRPRALSLLENAANAGLVIAMNNLGDEYAEHKAYGEARRWYEKSAAKESKYALQQLGQFFIYGLGVRVNYGRARQYLRKPAHAGYSTAQVLLAHLYHDGKGGPRNYSEAMRLYKLAASSKDDETAGMAMNGIGVMYVNGQGVKRNYKKAVRWYRMAVKKGNKFAARNLAQYRPGRTYPTRRRSRGGGSSRRRNNPSGFGAGGVPCIVPSAMCY